MVPKIWTVLIVTVCVAAIAGERRSAPRPAPQNNDDRIEHPVENGQAASWRRPLARARNPRGAGRVGERSEISRSCNRGVRKRMRVPVARWRLTGFSRLARRERPEMPFDAEIERDPVGFMSGVDSVAAQERIQRAAGEIDRD